MNPRTFDPPTIVLNALLSFLILVAPVPGAQSKSKNSYARESKVENLVLSTPEECMRECVKGAPPKICYYHFTMELYTTLGRACALSTANNTNSISSDGQCVSADGYERGILTVNRMLPGPSIHVCKGDKVVIDVKNAMDGMETTIHWHGLLQKGSQYYDGVPMLTQCPILHGTTFRYQFYAENEGTHFWHSHDGTQKLDGIYGKFIVRIPKKEDPNSYLYDYDLPEHEILISDWMHDFANEHLPGLLRRNVGQQPVSALINGKGRFTDRITGQTTNTSLAEFTVESGKSYRFRIINSFCTTCPAELTFEGHDLILIAVDGTPVKPMKINSANSFAGERYDFVLKANETAGTYWIQLRTLGGCAADQIQQLAILRYSGNHVRRETEPPTYNSSLPTGISFNPVVGNCDSANAICMDELKSARPVDKRITKKNPDIQFHLPISFFGYDDKQLFKKNTYERFTIAPSGRAAAAQIDNISHVFPPSPPLSQYKDIPSSQFCNNTYRPDNCGTPCFCSHKIDIKMGSVAELVLLDSVGDGHLNHPFHMHGYNYHVMSLGRSPYKNVTKMNASHARRMEKEGLFRRKFDLPPTKDTMAVPSGGYVIIRMLADNPGYWLFHCHFLYHHLAGMEMMIHVGDDEKDLPPVPKNFPVCGDHLPPIEIDRRHKFRSQQILSLQDIGT